MILILRREKCILGRIGLYFEDLGRSWYIFRDLGSKGKIVLGSQRNYFQGSGGISALFSGIKGAQTTPLGGLSIIRVFDQNIIKRATVKLICYSIRKAFLINTATKK